jgi:hypothetical protein
MKSPQAMSDHFIGQLDISNSSTILESLKVRTDSLRDSDKHGDRTSEIPPKKWSSIRVKDGSTKSLLIENGGSQVPLKSAIRKEVHVLSEF